MRRPKRPLNRCWECGHTWHPRGKDLSLRCPACGYADAYDPAPTWQRTALVVGVVATILLAVCGGIVLALLAPLRRG